MWHVDVRGLNGWKDNPQNSGHRSSGGARGPAGRAQKRKETDEKTFDLCFKKRTQRKMTSAEFRNANTKNFLATLTTTPHLVSSLAFANCEKRGSVAFERQPFASPHRAGH
tara:strand:+ start:79 stop:411 length:333 start_codon:yes stop_codon:yes gene_type:complete